MTWLSSIWDSYACQATNIDTNTTAESPAVSMVAMLDH
jgi:hypothetical protein